jgi:site-specific DNA recombinase
MTDSITKALIYCRVSDTKQKIEGSGLESQEFRCRQHAASMGYQVEKVFLDDVSGGGDFMKRLGMVSMLDYLNQHHQNNYTVIFDDLKRLARDTMAHLQLRHAMLEVGATVECLNYKFDDTPEGEFVETLFAAQGQLERKQIARQTRQKTKARLEAGYHAFIAPVGFKYEKTKTQGRRLLRDEPVASVISEMMEGFASGRFQTKKEAKVFLESAPAFPKTASGKIGNNQVDKMLGNPLYAGYIEYKPWSVSLRKGQHEGMVSYATFLKIQERLKGRANAPARKDLNIDFPLRGSVACVCGNGLTACWSKSNTGKLHAYYLCQNRRCEHKGKSIRRDVIEGEFEVLLKQLTPTQNLIRTASKMFEALWNHREASQQVHKETLEKQIQATEGKVDKLLERIVEAESPLVVKAFEKKIHKLQDNQRVMEEKIGQCGRPLRPYDDMYRTSLQFLENPHKIWALGRFEDKRAVLKLAFANRLTYVRNEGYRTPDLSMPFKVLGNFFGHENKMVPKRRLELPQGCPHMDLNHARLPIPPLRHASIVLLGAL